MIETIKMEKIKIIIITILVICAIGVSKAPILAYVMSSDNYRIQSDSINVGGGLGTSGSYKEEDTIGEIGTGYSSGTNYLLSAGYQQSDIQVYIAMTAPDSATMTPSIRGMTGGTASTSADIYIITNNPVGYTLLIKASTSPAMRHIASSSIAFENYIKQGSDPDYDWSVTSTKGEFGYTPEGLDIVDYFLDSGGQCNQGSGTDTPDACWDAVPSSDQTISQSATANEPAGATTTVKFRAESGSMNIQPSGTYRANIIMTAYMN